MENQIVTVADLVGAIIAEMERCNYKPSVIKQYRIVWDKLCAYSGAMPVGAWPLAVTSYTYEARRVDGQYPVVPGCHHRGTRRRPSDCSRRMRVSRSARSVHDIR
ncbi:hypothetical protein GCM10009712_03230 [Pseudarthrobacter sulfonivorans]